MTSKGLVDKVVKDFVENFKTAELGRALPADSLLCRNLARSLRHGLQKLLSDGIDQLSNGGIDPIYLHMGANVYPFFDVASFGDIFFVRDGENLLYRIGSEDSLVGGDSNSRCGRILRYFIYKYDKIVEGSEIEAIAGDGRIRTSMISLRAQLKASQNFELIRVGYERLTYRFTRKRQSIT